MEHHGRQPGQENKTKSLENLAELNLKIHRMTKISIVVPCYNSAKFLFATIESVLRQEFKGWELILVDDGSKDATWEIVSRYMLMDPRIIGHQKPNGGTSKARNFGFSKTNASSDYLFFLDHDDQLEPNALGVMSDYLDKHPEVGLLACQIQDVSAEGQRVGSNKVNRWAPGFIFPHKLRDDEHLTPFVTFFCAIGQGPFAMYRRTIYVQTEGWEEIFWPHEDTDIFCQMALLTQVHFLPDRLYLKRIHPAQGMSDFPRVQRSYNAFRLRWNNWHPKNAREAVLLRNAKKYYYSMHCPCRDLRVAGKTFLLFCAKPRFGRLKWIFQLVISALKGFLICRFKV